MLWKNCYFFYRVLLSRILILFRVVVKRAERFHICYYCCLTLTSLFRTTLCSESVRGLELGPTRFQDQSSINLPYWQNWKTDVLRYKFYNQREFIFWSYVHTSNLVIPNLGTPSSTYRNYYKNYTQSFKTIFATTF